MEFGGLDLRAGPLVTAFFGAMAYAVALKVKRPIDLASILVVGLGTSISIGPLIADYMERLGFQHVSADAIQNAAGFVSGLGGMVICNGLIVVIRKIMKMMGEKTETAKTGE